MTMRHFGNGGNVLNLHGDRAWALAPHQPRVSAKRRGDSCACLRWIVADLDAETAQKVIRELAIGSIDALGQQHMATAVEQGQMNQGNGRLPAGRDEGS